MRFASSLTYAVLSIFLWGFGAYRVQAETIYTTDFGTGLDKHWETFSTSSEGVIHVANRGSHAHVLNMNLKGSKDPSNAINTAVLAVDISRHRNIKLSFDHFATWDAADTNMFGPLSLGLLPVDGIMVSTDNNSWELAWMTPNTFSNGHMRLDDLDLSAALSTLIPTGNLFIRFQHRITFESGHLRSDGRGWDNISVSGMSVPEPTTLGLFLSGTLCANLLRRRRAVA